MAGILKRAEAFLEFQLKPSTAELSKQKNPCSSLNYTDFICLFIACLSSLLHLLKVGVLDVVFVGALVALLTGTGLLGSSGETGSGTGLVCAYVDSSGLSGLAPPTWEGSCIQ